MKPCWALKWRTRKHDHDHLIHEHCLPALFKTRSSAKLFARMRFGYISKRDDLKSKPHQWLMPKPVKVMVIEI